MRCPFQRPARGSRRYPSAARLFSYYSYCQSTSWKAVKPPSACPLFPSLLDPPAWGRGPPANPQNSPSLRGAGAGEVNPLPVSSGAGGPGLERDESIRSARRTPVEVWVSTQMPGRLRVSSLLLLCLLCRESPTRSPFGTPGQGPLSQAPPPPPALERGHRLLPGGSVRRGRGAAGCGAGLTATERSRSFSRSGGGDL